MIDFIKNCFNKSKCYFKEHKFCCLITLACFFLGIIIAIITLINLKSVLSLNNLNDSLLLLFLKKEIGLFTFFIRRFFIIFLIVVVIFLLCFNKYLSFINCLLFVYLGYIICFNIGVITICFGFFGLIFSIIINLVFGILYSLCFLTMFLFFNNCCAKKSYIFNIKNNFNFLLFLLIFVLILLILETLLTPIFSSVFIVIFL